MTCWWMGGHSYNIAKLIATIAKSIKVRTGKLYAAVLSKYPFDELAGFCTLCGAYVRYNKTHPSIRESYRCKLCGASARERYQAKVILNRFSKHGSKSIKVLVEEPEIQTLKIYELTLKGRFSRYFCKLPNYTHSYYWEDVLPGEYYDGVQCQDVMSLTYSDNSFDLIISSDVFEHVRHPLVGFREIARVLKPKGIHCWTVPAPYPLACNTHYRVDTRGITDIYIDPPSYHIDAVGGKSLVYTEFGEDICEELKKFGLDTEIIRAKSKKKRITKIFTFVSTKHEDNAIKNR